MVWMFPLPSSYVEILTPKVMVLGGGVFGRSWGHESGAFMMRLVSFQKKPQRAPTMWAHSHQVWAVNQKEDPH